MIEDQVIWVHDFDPFRSNSRSKPKPLSSVFLKETYLSSFEFREVFN